MTKKTPKTPAYTRKAIKAFRARGVQKQITFNPRREDEAELLEAIGADKMPFSTRVKQLLSEHYGIQRDE